MTSEDIILMQANLINYSIVMKDCIENGNYKMAMTALNVCRAYLLNLRYIQEQEERNNASIK